MAAQDAQGGLNRVHQVQIRFLGLEGLDLEQLDADDPLAAAPALAGRAQAVALGPLADERRIRLAQVRAEGEVIGQE